MGKKQSDEDIIAKSRSERDYAIAEMRKTAEAFGKSRSEKDALFVAALLSFHRREREESGLKF